VEFSPVETDCNGPVTERGCLWRRTNQRREIVVAPRPLPSIADTDGNPECRRPTQALHRGQTTTGAEIRRRWLSHFTAAAAFALVRTRQRQLPMEAKGAEQGTIYLRQATRREQRPRPKPWGESRSPRRGFRTEYDGHDRGGGDI
jgi:hypothetical protein